MYTARWCAWVIVGGVAVVWGGTGCGDSTNSGGAGGAGGTGVGGATSASSASGSGGASAELTCDHYCQVLTQNCVAANQQFTSLESCLAVCGSYEPGTLADQSGDTLGCRIYQTGFTKLAADTKCAHAGPSGGDLHGGLPGICGDGCEAFCRLEAVACTGANQQYATDQACMTACAAFPGQASADDFDTGDVSGDTFNCRLYHLTAAATDPATHCMHTKPSANGDPCRRI